MTEPRSALSESLDQKLAHLQTSLETALAARRRYFLMGCACYELADVDARDPARVLSKADTAMLDEALDKYDDACHIVRNCRTQISNVRLLMREANRQAEKP